MRITHDIHNHTTLSRCCYDPRATAAAFIERTEELGHTVFGISNHLWDEKVPGASAWYKNQMISYGLQLRDCLPRDSRGLKVLLGVETEYAAASDTLGMLAETAKQFDYVLVPHSHTHMRDFVMEDNADARALRAIFAERIAAALPELSAEQVKKMANTLGYTDIDAIVASGRFFEPTVDMEKYVADKMVESFNSLMANSEFIKLAAAVPTSVAHPFMPCGFQKEVQRRIINLIPDEVLLDSFSRASALGVAIEVNTASLRFPEDDYAEEPHVRMMKLALKAGCRFTFGTDSHSLAGLDSIRKGDDFSRVVGIGEENLADIVR